MASIYILVLILLGCLDGGAGHEQFMRTSFQSQQLSSSLHTPFLESQRVAASGPQAGGSCARECGKVHVPYPFGLSPECAFNSYFLLRCVDKSRHSHGLSVYFPEPGLWPYLTNVSTSVQGSYPFLGENSTEWVGTFEFQDSELQILNLTTNGTLIINSTDFKATQCGENFFSNGNASMSLPDNGPYRISDKNLVLVSGCTFTGHSSSAVGSGQCGPNTCNNFYHENDYCNFYDCCTLQLQQALLNITLFGIGGPMYNANHDLETCSFATLLYPPTYSTRDSRRFGEGIYGMEILWSLPVNRTMYKNCTSLQQSRDYSCSEWANCTYTYISPPADFAGYHCDCLVPGYEGDGYLNGTQCTDIDECSRTNDCLQEAKCTNLDGSYNCTCPSLKEGDGMSTGTGCTYIKSCASNETNDCAVGAVCTDIGDARYECKCSDQLKGDGLASGTGCQSKSNTALIAGVSAGCAVVFVFINCLVCSYLYKRRRKLHNQGGSFGPDFSRADFLREIQSSEGANICRLFTYDELERATDNFSNDRVLGSGGFGTVFEGTLDGSLKLAIKKAKHNVGQGRNDTKQFINEVTILSQINHRNLVKLLGCCLETAVPILVYEFISNGTLSEHLRPDRAGTRADEGRTRLDWSMRLKIAVGTAEALTYLHFGTSPPIYHRDVKSDNILLDDNCVPRVADFGLSKFVALDVTHLSTAIQGTPGYLDPDYFDNYQITDKSDVYSFGVVLLELVTSEKAVDLSRQARDYNLALRCGRLWQHGRLSDIIDPVLCASTDSEILESVLAVAKVGIWCVQRHTDDRPNMKQALEELHSIGKLKATDSDTGSLPDIRSKKSKIPKFVRFEDDDAQPLTSGSSINSQDFLIGSSASSADLVSPVGRRSRDVFSSGGRRSSRSLKTGTFSIAR